MKRLLFAFVVTVSLAALAADPAWPTDFAANVKAREASVLATSTTSEASAAGTFDFRAVTFAAATSATPIEPRTFTWEISNMIDFRMLFPGLMFIVR